MSNEKPPGFYAEQQQEMLFADNAHKEEHAEQQQEMLGADDMHKEGENADTEVESVITPDNAEAVVTPSTAEAVAGQDTTLEADPLEQVRQPFRAVRAEGLISPTPFDRPLFPSNFPERAKQVVSDVYEGMYKIPGVSRVVGKLEIAYNNFWIQRHEKKNTELKVKMDTSDRVIATLNDTKSRFESLKTQFASQNRPGLETFDVQMKKIDAKVLEEINKKDKVQSKLEERDNKVKEYTNQRDGIADKLIGRYEQKLDPMERNLESLQNRKEQLDLLTSVTEMQHNEQLIELTRFEKQRQELAENYRSLGLSERTIKKDSQLAFLNDLIVEGRKNIQFEKQKLAQRKAEIDSQVAKIDKKANPYRDKRDEFVRIKALRPVDFKIEDRVREVDEIIREDVTARSRIDATKDTTVMHEESVGTDVEKTSEKVKLGDLLSLWNEFLKQNKDKSLNSEVINQEDFRKRTYMSSEYGVRPREMKNILEKYYKVLKVTPDKRVKLQKSFSEFIDANLSR